MKDYEAGELLKFAEMFNLEDLKHWSKLVSFFSLGFFKEGN